MNSEPSTYVKQRPTEHGDRLHIPHLAAIAWESVLTPKIVYTPARKQVAVWAREWSRKIKLLVDDHGSNPSRTGVSCIFCFRQHWNKLYMSSRRETSTITEPIFPWFSFFFSRGITMLYIKNFKLEGSPREPFESTCDACCPVSLAPFPSSGLINFGVPSSGLIYLYFWEDVAQMQWKSAPRLTFIPLFELNSGSGIRRLSLYPAFLLCLSLSLAGQKMHLFTYVISEDL